MSTMPPRSRCTTPRRFGRLQARDSLGDVVERQPELETDGDGGEHVVKIPAAEKRSRDHPFSCWRDYARPAAWTPSSLTSCARTVACSDVPKVTTRPRNVAPASSPGSSALQTSTSLGLRAFQNFGLGVGDGVRGPEKADVGIADIRPDAHVGPAMRPGSRISPAWFMPSSMTATWGRCAAAPARAAGRGGCSDCRGSSRPETGATARPRSLPSSSSCQHCR